MTIRLVVLCAEHGSISLAAKNAHITKSAASERISELEATLGKPLLRRDHLGVTPTPAGAVVVNYGRSILGALDALESTIRAMD